MKKINLFICLAILLINFAHAQNRGRDKWQKPESIMDSIGIKEGNIIGEVGAGSGYFTLKLAKRVGKSGLVYANDIKNSVLKDLENNSKKEGLENVKTIVGKTENPLFPDSTMDMVVMMYVFHDLTKPIALMKNIKPCLKTGAKVVIIDRDPNRFGEDYDHFMSKSEIIQKVKESGYTIEKIWSFLPRDNIYLCNPEGS